MPLGKWWLWGDECNHLNGKSVRCEDTDKIINHKRIKIFRCVACNKIYKYRNGSTATNEEL